jgi:hypothetical protein
MLYNNIIVVAPIDEIIKRRVVQQWLAGDSRPKIAIDNNIGEGTVSGIVSEFKIGLDSSEFDSARELALQAKKQGFNLSELASHLRLYNYFLKSGAAEDKIESFITKVSSNDLPPEKVIELVYQLHEISKSESVPLDEVSGYIKGKLEDKQKIDKQIKEADAILQSKNVSIEAINEHIHLKQELKNYRLSTKDIHRLVNLLVAAKEYRYSPGKIVSKLRNIKRLENKEVKLKSSCEILAKKQARYKDIIPFTEEIVAFGIGIQELIGLEVAIKEAAKMYNLSFFNSTLRLIDDIKSYNRINGLGRELDRLSLQKYALDQACSRQSKVIMALMNLKSHGITEDRILELNKFLENNEYKDTRPNTYVDIK